MGKTEKLHQMDAYIDLDYKNEFGTKSENGRNFGRMISRALQNAVSNSCRNYRSRELIELKTDDIFITEPAGFRQGNGQQNQGYISPQVENAVAEAQRRGTKRTAASAPPKRNSAYFLIRGIKNRRFYLFPQYECCHPLLQYGQRQRHSH